MEDIWEYIPGLKDTVMGAPVHRNYSFLCTMYSLQGSCTCEKLTRSLDWRLHYRRQFLRSKDLGQEEVDAGLVEGAQDVLRRRKNPRIREHLISPCSYIFHDKKETLCLFAILFWPFYSYISRNGSSLRWRSNRTAVSSLITLLKAMSGENQTMSGNLCFFAIL